MEKRFSLADTGNGVKAIKCAVVSVLTDEEVKKFADKKLRKQINVAAKDYHLQWTIECDNATVLFTWRIAMEFNAQDTHALEMDTTNFLAAINKMELEKTTEEDVVALDELKQANKDVEFVKEVLEDLEDGNCITLALLSEIQLGDSGIVLPYGNISARLAKEMCKCFIEHSK